MENRPALARGPDVVVEFTKMRAPCAALNRYGAGLIQKAIYDEMVRDGDPASPHWGLSGCYARVIEGGTIHPGDISSSGMNFRSRRRERWKS